MERTTCSIWTDAFADMPPATATVELPACRHAFCQECLGGWWSASASSVSNSCPDCRRVYSGLRRCPRSTAGAMTTAALAAHSAEADVSAAPKHQRTIGLIGNDQAVNDVESSEEEDCEPVAKRRKKSATTSEYVGISWDKKRRKWRAHIKHDGKEQHLGSFDDEREVAKAADTAARRLRGEDAHGGRSGTNWHRLNFPTEGEVRRAQERGALLMEEEKTAAAAASAGQGPSKFVGVCWDKRRCKWTARITHDGKQQHLGSFDDEREAARAVDTAARRLRGEDAHGGRAGTNWLRLNFPTEGEVKRAKERGMLLTEEDKAVAVAASERQGPSKFVGVTWHKRTRKWKAQSNHDGKKHHLGSFDDERKAAQAVDTAARRLRGEDAHGGRAGGTGKIWLRLNFPTDMEVKRAKDRGALLTDEDKAAAAAASERQAPSKFVGVCWNKQRRKWKATISHGGKDQSLGSFDDEHEAARAVDMAARRLRGDDAHGGRAGRHWLRLNFPSKREAGRAKALDMPAAH
eukprot:COSAG06_NODE_410_length_16089_cov_9.968793_15_plen_519_part_00